MLAVTLALKGACLVKYTPRNIEQKLQRRRTSLGKHNSAHLDFRFILTGVVPHRSGNQPPSYRLKNDNYRKYNAG